MEPIQETDQNTINIDNKQVSLVIVLSVLTILLLLLMVVGFYGYQQHRINFDLQNEVDTLKNTLQQQMTPSPIPTPTPIPSNLINYFPIKYLVHDSVGGIGDFQKVGQTFILSESRVVNRVILKGSDGVGDGGILQIYRTPDPRLRVSTPLLATGSFIPEDITKESEFNVLLDTPVELEANLHYFFVVEITESAEEAGIGFVEEDIYEGGEMYQYTRTIGGNGAVINSSHSWQPMNTYDLIFELR